MSLEDVLKTLGFSKEEFDKFLEKHKNDKWLVYTEDGVKLTKLSNVDLEKVVLHTLKTIRINKPDTKSLEHYGVKLNGTNTQRILK